MGKLCTPPLAVAVAVPVVWRIRDVPIAGVAQRGPRCSSLLDIFAMSPSFGDGHDSPVGGGLGFGAMVPMVLDTHVSYSHMKKQSNNLLWAF